jgi:signal transduction histidine kinase
VPLRTDPSLALRILQNLLSNAIKFTPAGSVTLRVMRSTRGERLPDTDGAADDPVVLWEVADTGIGIAADALEVIFDEFRQVDGSVTRRYGGSGMGLALSRGLARRLGGEITVGSEVGRGSVFCLVLPQRHDFNHTPPAPEA